MTRTRARVPDDARISFEVGTQRPAEASYLSVEPFEMLWVVTNGKIRRNLFRIKLIKTGLYVSLCRDGNIHSSYHSDGNCHWKSAYYDTVDLPTRPALQEVAKAQLISNGTITIADDVLDAFELTEFGDEAVDRVVYLDNRKLPPTIAYEVWAVPPFKHAEVALRTDFPAHIHVVTHTVPWIEVIVYEQGERNACTLKTRQIGPWTKRRRLGAGGNGEVWNCRDASGETCAVKFLKEKRERKEHSVSFGRFCHEITLLREIGHHTGILPLLDSNLPPDDHNPPGIPWFSMPEAISLKDGFSDETSLEEIVAGVRNVATALALLSENGIHHRDIKPENLFVYEGSVVIGDFGLATYPGKESLTVENRKLGPLHFIAPEMLEYREGTDESLSDVYSLAKTLWVLVTGQKYPPPGEQRISEPLLTTSMYRNHSRCYLLDRLIESATWYDPKRRINLQDFAKELQAWNYISPSTVSTMNNEIYKLIDRIHTALSTPLTKDAEKKAYLDLYNGSKEELASSLKEFYEKIPCIEDVVVSFSENQAIRGSLGDDSGVSLPLEGSMVVLCGPGRFQRPLMMCCLGICDLESEKTTMIAHHVISIENVVPPRIVWSEKKEILLGGSTMKQAIGDLIKGLEENFEGAFRVYTQIIEEHKHEIK